VATVFTEIRRSRVPRRCGGGCGHPIEEGDLYERVAIAPGRSGDGWIVIVQHASEEYMQRLLRTGEYQAADDPREGMGWTGEQYL
jgi:hypothetical protein